MANRKEMATIMKLATKHGWAIALNKNNHYKWTSPSGAFFYSSSTPSDRRALERLKSDLRRLGFDLRKLDNK
jgi:hypothetical protein